MYVLEQIFILCSAYISQVFNFVNFVNFESFAKFIQLKFEPLHCQAHGQHASAKFFSMKSFKTAFCENVDLRNMSGIW